MLTLDPKTGSHPFERHPLQHPVCKGFLSSGGLNSRCKRWAVRQFGRPTGFWGHVAGMIMAHRGSNVERNRWTVDLLEVRHADRVLEIGFGPGLALKRLGKFTPLGRVHGIDHSPAMLKQARWRNAAALRKGRMELRQGAAGSLPAAWNRLDKVMAVNVAMFWSDPVGQLRLLRERIAPGGRIALTVQPRAKGANLKDALRAGLLLTGQLEQAGFVKVRLEVLPLQPVAAVCALGEQEAAQSRPSLFPPGMSLFLIP